MLGNILVILPIELGKVFNGIIIPPTTIDGIKNVKGKNLFILHWKDSNGDGSMPIQVDQPSELILNRMKEIVDGKRDKLYLTRGMRDIDVSYLGDNK